MTKHAAFAFTLLTAFAVLVASGTAQAAEAGPGARPVAVGGVRIDQLAPPDTWRVGSRIGTVDGQPLLLTRHAGTVAVTVAASPTHRFATSALRGQWCARTVSAVLLALGAVGLTAVLVAAGPTATGVYVAGRFLARKTVEEVRNLLGAGSALSAVISGRVC